MANKNETECGCMGIYNSSTNSCDDIPVGVDACPENGGGFWNTIGGWDWKAISENSLQWGYALGFLNESITNVKGPLLVISIFIYSPNVPENILSFFL